VIIKLRITDNPALLSRLTEDMKHAPEYWRATEYWQGYGKRITNRIQDVGLTGFRTDWNIIKGHGLIDPVLPDPHGGDSRKNRLHKILSKLPVFNQVSTFYIDQIQSEVARHKSSHQMLVAMITESLMADPDIREKMEHIQEGTAGMGYDDSVNPASSFSLDFLINFSKIAVLDSAIDVLSKKRVLEIGGGHGKFAEIFTKLGTDPDRGYCLIDIPPVLYIATEYLRSEFPDRVVDYEQLVKMDRITDADIKGKILIMPPWLIDKLEVNFDVFWNAASFQEMEKNVVTEYLDRIAKRCDIVGINSLTYGHAQGAGGQLEPITLHWLSDEINSRGYRELSLENKSQANTVLDIANSSYEIKIFQKPEE
jgi:putative sugar O-methyltransferase